MKGRLDSVYITYWSLLDPLCQSQSLPYLHSLTRQGYRVGLITFEQPRWRMSPEDRKAKRSELASRGIEWHPVSYHKRPPVFSTLYDIGVGSLVAAIVARRSRATFIHGRASVPSAIAAVAAKLAGTRLFIDADGPLSQEYLDAGVWSERSLGHRLTAWGERRSMELADVVAVLTDHRKREVAPWLAETPIYVLPCAVDLTRFRPMPEHRQVLRNELGLKGTVFVYAGKPGGWYATEEMVAFVAAAREVFDPLTLLVLTGEDPAVFAELCERAEVPFVSRAVPPNEMPAYLSSSDVGLCFLHPFPSKLSCSPIKLGEYLACGLPVVSTSGCGDYDHLIPTESLGIVVSSTEREAYPQAAKELECLLADPDIRDRCRDAASRSVGLREVVAPRYAEIYQRLSDGNDS
ncbi:MAG: glycosyltransferase [Deltaproteobacteria bacterium]|nr:glycosyltransferase [Deltaproteobacteria bacterium]